MIDIALDVPIVSINRLVSEHFLTRARRRRRERAAIILALSGQLRPPGPCWEVTITRIGPRALDGDNLIVGAKSIRDEVSAYLGVDDSDPSITWRYASEIQRVHVPAWQGDFRIVPAHFKVWTRVVIATRATYAEYG